MSGVDERIDRILSELDRIVAKTEDVRAMNRSVKRAIVFVFFAWVVVIVAAIYIALGAYR